MVELVARYRRRRAWHGAPGLRSPAHALRREGLAGHLLHDRDGALDHERDSVGVERTPWRAVQGAAREALRRLTTLTNRESDDAGSRMIGNVRAPVSWVLEHLRQREPRALSLILHRAPSCSARPCSRSFRRAVLTWFSENSVSAISSSLVLPRSPAFRSAASTTFIRRW